MKKVLFIFAVAVATTLNMAAQQVSFGFSYVSPKAAAEACRLDGAWLNVENGYSDALEMSYYNFNMRINGVAYKATYYADGTLLFIDRYSNIAGSYKAVYTEDAGGQVIVTFINNWEDDNYDYVAMYVAP
jgi:hypothetical protein